MQFFHGSPTVFSLFISILAAGQTVTGGKLEKYGCSFDDDKYALNVMIPTWADSPRAPKEFKDVDDFNQFIGKVQPVYSQFMADNVRSDVDRILRFYQAFKKQNSSKLEEFFNSYTVEYKPNEDSAGLTIELFNQLKTTLPEIEKHVYLVSANMDLGYEYTTDYFRLATAMPQDYFHGYTAGAMKIKVGSRAGVVLFNLEIGVEKPIVLMEDGSAPHMAQCAGGDSHKIQYYLKNGFILANVFMTEEKEEHGQMKTIESIGQKHLTYIEKPYCSFIQKAKANLLSPEHGIVSRKANGGPSEFVQLRLVPTKVRQSRHEIVLMVFEEKDKKFVRTEGRVALNSLETKSGAPTTVADEINMVKNNADLVKMKGDELLQKLRQVKSVIFDDEDLVTQIYQLEEKLWKKDTDNSCSDVNNVMECLKTMSGARKLIKNLK
ncbi:hypothetical protein WDU94_012844 [Cyamophila willieti]